MSDLCSQCILCNTATLQSGAGHPSLTILNELLAIFISGKCFSNYVLFTENKEVYSGGEGGQRCITKQNRVLVRAGHGNGLNLIPRL